ELLVPGPNVDQGYGLLNVERAVTSRLHLVDSKTGVATGETLEYELEPGVQKVTLVYSDAPASPLSAKALVNNIDIEVFVDGKVFKGESEIDNSEQVVLES